MSDIFIRKSDGKEFEMLTDLYGDNHIVIKPIKKAEEKKLYNICVWSLKDNFRTDDNILSRDYKLTEPQAEAIAKAIKIVIEYITYPGNLHKTNRYDFYNGEFGKILLEARNLMQEESDNE